MVAARRNLSHTHKIRGISSERSSRDRGIALGIRLQGLSGFSCAGRGDCTRLSLALVKRSPKALPRQQEPRGELLRGFRGESGLQISALPGRITWTTLLGRSMTRLCCTKPAAIARRSPEAAGQVSARSRRAANVRTEAIPARNPTVASPPKPAVGGRQQLQPESLRVIGRPGRLPARTEREARMAGVQGVR